MLLPTRKLKENNTKTKMWKLMASVFGLTEAKFLYQISKDPGLPGRFLREVLKQFLCRYKEWSVSCNEITSPWVFLLDQIRMLSLETKDKEIQSFGSELYIKNIWAAATICRYEQKENKENLGNMEWQNYNFDFRAFLTQDEILKWGGQSHYFLSGLCKSLGVMLFITIFYILRNPVQFAKISDDIRSSLETELKNWNKLNQKNKNCEQKISHGALLELISVLRLFWEFRKQKQNHDSNLLTLFPGYSWKEVFKEISLLHAKIQLERKKRKRYLGHARRAAKITKLKKVQK
jgi:hypothetical protein